MTIQRAPLRCLYALALGGLFLVGSPGLALAQDEAVATDVSAEEDRASAWRDQLGELHTMLSEKSYEQARDLADSLAEDLKDHLGVGEEASYTMAVVAAFRAIAEVGLENREDGLWYWRMATSLHPPFAERDLTPYGEPAVWLTDQEYRGNFRPPASSRGVIEPRVRETPSVDVPGTVASLVSETVEIVVETVVGIDGRPREPRLVSAPEVPALIYTGLEALKDWRFSSATYDDKPVAVLHEVTVEVGG